MNSNNNLNGNRLLKSEDVAAYLNISRSFAYKLMASGELATIRVGRSIRVREEHVRAFILQHSTGALEVAAVGEEENCEKTSQGKGR